MTEVTDPGLRTFDSNESLERTHASMEAAGEKVEDIVYVDTFSFDETCEYELPDSGGQKIFFQKMNEGQKASFQKDTNKDVRIQRTTGDARMKVDPAGERWALIRASVTGWSLRRRDGKGNVVEVMFDQKMLAEWLRNTNPKYVDGLEKAIREENEWLQSEMTVEEIDREIDNLKQQRERLEENDAKKESL